MTDKRSPQSPAFQSPKRSKTFPLAQNDEPFCTPCRRDTAPVAEHISAPKVSSLSKHKDTEDETEEHEFQCAKDIPIDASPSRGIEDKPVENDDGSPASQVDDTSDESPDASVPRTLDRDSKNGPSESNARAVNTDAQAVNIDARAVNTDAEEETTEINGNGPRTAQSEESDSCSDAFVPRSFDGDLEHEFSEFAAREGNRDVEDETARKDGDGLPASQREAYESDEVPDAFVPRDWESDDDSDAFVPRSVDSGSEPRSMFQLEDLDKELGRWTPPEEPLRPENPYRKGKIVEIRKHTASMPFGQFYPNFEGERECAPERELRLKTLVELCVDRPPLEGKVIADEKAQTLEIVDEIRVKEDGGAQIVVCRFSGSEEQVVAKIYDPLYYGFANRMWSDQPRDVTYEAEKDYCREVAAYLELDDQFGGTDIPKYHGSWTFQLPIDLPDGQKTRDIRLILMEHIKGKPMTDLKPEDFPESVGLELVKRFVEVDCRIRFAGVTHGDVSQRNIMVCLTEPDIVERVALIDFNFAVVNRLDDFEQQTGRTRKPGPDKLPNPVNIWWGGGLYGFAGEWFPKSWDFRLRACQEWLYENYGTSEEYMPPKTPLNWDEENLPQRWIAY